MRKRKKELLDLMGLEEGFDGDSPCGSRKWWRITTIMRNLEINPTNRTLKEAEEAYEEYRKLKILLKKENFQIIKEKHGNNFYMKEGRFKLGYNFFPNGAFNEKEMLRWSRIVRKVKKQLESDGGKIGIDEVTTDSHISLNRCM